MQKLKQQLKKQKSFWVLAYDFVPKMFAIRQLAKSKIHFRGSRYLRADWATTT
jgi:hypothetical protein